MYIILLLLKIINISLLYYITRREKKTIPVRLCLLQQQCRCLSVLYVIIILRFTKKSLRTVLFRWRFQITSFAKSLQISTNQQFEVRGSYMSELGTLYIVRRVMVSICNVRLIIGVRAYVTAIIHTGLVRLTNGDITGFHEVNTLTSRSVHFMRLSINVYFLRVQISFLFITLNEGSCYS